MRIGVFLSLALAMSSSLVVEAQVSKHIEVFTDTRHPIATAMHRGIVIYRLDTLKRFEQQLSAGLPADIKAARNEAIHRVQLIGRPGAAELERAQEGLLRARRYRLDRYPAIVFDAAVVVYGVTHMDTALLQYRRWRKQHEARLP